LKLGEFISLNQFPVLPPPQQQKGRNIMRILVDLREMLDQTAKKIAEDEPNPGRWDTAILYLMEALEAEAEGHKDGIQVYEKMLQKVRDALSDQLEDQTWGY
jgi:rubrerythrin